MLLGGNGLPKARPSALASIFAQSLMPPQTCPSHALTCRTLPLNCFLECTNLWGRRLMPTMASKLRTLHSQKQYVPIKIASAFLLKSLFEFWILKARPPSSGASSRFTNVLQMRTSSGIASDELASCADVCNHICRMVLGCNQFQSRIEESGALICCRRSMFGVLMHVLLHSGFVGWWAGFTHAASFYTRSCIACHIQSHFLIPSNFSFIQISSDICVWK